MPAKKTIIVAGMVASDPYQGGATWAVLQYVLGLRRLGHQVYLIEPVSSSDCGSSYAERQGTNSAKYFRDVIDDFGLESSAALVLQESHHTIGLGYREIEEVASRTDVLFNISGLLTDPNLLGRIACRAYLDLDPAFNQLWHHHQGIDRHFAGHHFYFTVGQNIGMPGCPIPTCGLKWNHTLPPVVLDYWPALPPISAGPLTTVANWRGYGSIEFGGVAYGQKAHSFRRIIELPGKTKVPCEPALAINQGEANDLKRLSENGWRLIDPLAAAGTPARYREFIARSWAELGVAKSGYVDSRSGWFSDRSACYLATGRPVIAHDTGFGSAIQPGAGLFLFDDVDDILEAIRRIETEPAKHACAARQIAMEHFDSDRVLKALLATMGCS